jgi:LmeA-like phospholipid-binding
MLGMRAPLPEAPDKSCAIRQHSATSMGKIEWVTNPQEPPRANRPSMPAPPGEQTVGGPHARSSEAPTQNLRVGPSHRDYGHEAPTVVHRLPQSTNQSQRTEQIGVTSPFPPQAGYQPPPTQPLAASAGQPASFEGSASVPTKRRLRKPLVILLIGVILAAVALAGLVGGEVYARTQAESKLAHAVACQAKDTATVNFSAMPPVLWQVITDHFTNISVHTAGNQLGTAKGMKADVTVQDVDLSNTPGRLGAMDGTITWPTDGIKDTVAQKISEFTVKTVRTHAGDGTIELKGTLITVILKPQVNSGKLSVQVVSVNVGKGFLTFPLGKEKEKAQAKVDDMINKFSDRAPLGIQVDSVQVTDSGITAHFSTHNATLPAPGSNPCFANL